MTALAFIAGFLIGAIAGLLYGMARRKPAATVSTARDGGTGEEQ